MGIIDTAGSRTGKALKPLLVGSAAIVMMIAAAAVFFLRPEPCVPREEQIRMAPPSFRQAVPRHRHPWGTPERGTRREFGGSRA